MNRSLAASVRASLVEQQMIGPGDTVVVAVSGGPDSLCLLHVLNALRGDLDIALHVAHLDHMLRGAESADEAVFVAATARALGLPITAATIDVRAALLVPHTNLHQAAREARYAFLAQVARQNRARAVAVAHNADDQAETVLMHLLRGAGPAGLRGMRPVVPWEEWAGTENQEPRTKNQEPGVEDNDQRTTNNESGNTHHVTCNTNPATGDRRPATGEQPTADNRQRTILIRPLLQVTRAEIEAYCAAHDLQPRRDPTNLDLSATRNRIRHELLPRLIEYNPHIIAALGRTAAICADEHDVVRQALAAAWPALARERPGAVDFAGDAWRALHPALQREALRRAYTLLGGSATLELEQVEAARTLVERGVGGRIELPGGIPLTVGYGGALTIGIPQEADGPQLAEQQVPLPAPGRVALAGGWMIEAVECPPDPQGAPPPASPWEVYLDADALAGPLVARRRRPGDRYRPAGGRGSRRLQDAFVDAKVPRALRAAWPIVATTGAVVWVPGLRPAADFIATAAARRMLRLRVVRTTP